MKQTFSIAVLLVVAALSSPAAYIYSWNVNSAIPDNGASGFVNNQSIGLNTQGNNLPSSPIIASVVGVTLNLSGGWNGDLYAYLRYETTAGVGFTTLLNRVGTSTSPFNPIGYVNPGMNVFLTDNTGSDIHTYGGAGVPTGTYRVDQTGSSTSFSSFAGLDPTAGTWSIFFADKSGNHVSTLDSWGLTLEVVPEPTTWALGIFGGIGGITALARWCRKPKTETLKC
jgi:hypothetical protein